MATREEQRKLEDLRRHADSLLQSARTEVARMSPGRLEALVHELQVHQGGLEMQNEELLRTQIDLQEARDQARLVYDFSPSGYITLDERRVIREASLTAALQLGVSRSELLERKLSDFIAPEDRDIFYHWRRELAEAKTKTDCELRFVRPDGGVFWARLEGVLSLDQYGEASRIRVYMTDVTASRRAEEGLAEATRQLRAVFDASLDPIVSLGPAGVIQQASRSLEKTFGWKAEEVLGRHVNLLIAGPQRQTHNEYLAQCRRMRRTGFLGVTRELEAVRRDGSVLPVEVSLALLDAPGGEPSRCIEIIRDITDRKFTDRMLRGERLHYLGMLRGLVGEEAYGVVIMSPAREIVLWNEGARNLFGYLQEEILGRDFAEVLTAPEEREGWRRLLEPRSVQELREGKAVRFEARALQKGGGRLPVSVVLSPILREPGVLIAIIAICRGISGIAAP